MTKLPSSYKIRPEPRYSLTIEAPDSASFMSEEIPNPTPDNVVYDQLHPFEATLKENRRITALDWEQDVRHLVFDITSSGFE